MSYERHIRYLVLLIIPLFILLFFACSSRTATSTPSPMTSEAKSSSVGPERSNDGWKDKWEKWVQEAKKEGWVVVYSTAGEQARVDLGKAFKNKFGIPMEYISGVGGVLARKLLTERQAGLYLADVYIGGSTTPITQMKPIGALDPLEPVLILPEAVEPAAWWGGGLRWIDKDRTVLACFTYSAVPLGINAKLVEPSEIKSYNDLLNPKWKGKIIIGNPTVAGLGQMLHAIIGGRIMGSDYLRELVKQEPLVISDQRQMVEWVAQGKYPIVIYPKTDIITEFKRAGAPIAGVTPVEGTFITGGSGDVSLINRAAHPNAARVFINWLLTREGQTIFSQAHGSPSGRLDVTTEGLNPELVVKPGGKYVPGDDEELLLGMMEDRQKAMEIFGSLLKK